MFLLTLAGCLSACGNQEHSPDRVIAVAVDMSDSTKAIGKAVAFGAEFAASKYKFKVVTLDDENNPRTAMANAFRIAADRRFVAVIGHASSGQTMSGQAVYGRFGVPLLMPVATASNITIDSAKIFRRNNAFRLVPTNDAQAEALTELVTKRARHHLSAMNSGKSRPSIILAHDYSSYASDLLHKVQAKLKQQQIDILNDHEDPYNFEPVVNSVRFDDVDTVLYVGYYKEAGSLIKQIRGIRLDAKYSVPVPIVLADGAFQGDLFGDLGRHRRDIFLTFPAPEWSSHEALKPLLKQYEDRKRGQDFELSFAPFAADAVELIAQALSGTSADTDARKRLLAELGSQTEHQGMTGAYRFNNLGDAENGRYYVYRMSEDRQVFELAQGE